MIPLSGVKEAAKEEIGPISWEALAALDNANKAYELGKSLLVILACQSFRLSVCLYVVCLSVFHVVSLDIGSSIIRLKDRSNSALTPSV